ncbi:hypothetical protein PHMEG_00015924 [Phytophthora megakarya]|uniref:ZSWIM1/3 RNaseH-like domain-containing protein n=1 Tax=Phytophthora megakarya TaxID=4795 RepID=A0A225W1L3_9STRA|nr:hypothetical protein PHMEG_00015924 [Phytophthora megakarya]
MYCEKLERMCMEYSSICVNILFSHTIISCWYGRQANYASDVHNMVQRHKTEETEGLNDAQRAFRVLDGFCKQHGGNSAEVVVDCETDVILVVTFQTVKMKRLFKAFPEVIMVDTTHDTNSNRYKLFCFVVHDVFGKGQYVHHALVQTEHMVNLRRVVEGFKSNNPEWTKVRVIITNKTFHEKKVLLEMFPKVRQLLCQSHVLTWLKKQAGRLAPNVKKEVKSLIRLLVCAASTRDYEDAKDTLLEQLGEWVTYKHGNVPQLTNNTNNRIESKWGKKKDVIDESFSVDQLLSTLITLQEYAEGQYLAEYHRVGSRPARPSEDQLSVLGMPLSSFISKQHAFAAGPDADYEVLLGAPGSATLVSPRSGNEYEVNTRLHEDMPSSVSARYILEANLQLRDCNTTPAFFSFKMDCSQPCQQHRRQRRGYRWVEASNVPTVAEGKSSVVLINDLAETIIDRMTHQSTPTYRVALRWLDFYKALHTGDVVNVAVASNYVRKPKTTKVSQKSTKSERSAIKMMNDVTWPLSSGPVISGMTKAQRKRAQSKKDREVALELTKKYRQGKVDKIVHFDDVAALLDGHYSLFHSKPMIDALKLPSVEVKGPIP